MTFKQDIAVEQGNVTQVKKVEVSVDGDSAVIRMSTYADGIGWFVQKTITVDAEMLDVLAEQFCSARGTIRREGDEILSAQVLDF